MRNAKILQELIAAIYSKIWEEYTQTNIYLNHEVLDVYKNRDEHLHCS